MKPRAQHLSFMRAFSHAGHVVEPAVLCSALRGTHQLATDRWNASDGASPWSGGGREVARDPAQRGQHSLHHPAVPRCAVNLAHAWPLRRCVNQPRSTAVCRNELTLPVVSHAGGGPAHGLSHELANGPMGHRWAGVQNHCVQGCACCQEQWQEY